MKNNENDCDLSSVHFAHLRKMMKTFILKSHMKSIHFAKFLAKFTTKMQKRE